MTLTICYLVVNLNVYALFSNNKFVILTVVFLRRVKELELLRNSIEFNNQNK